MESIIILIGIDYPNQRLIMKFLVQNDRRDSTLYSEEYTFYITYSSGAVLWVNGTMVINGWNDMWNVTNTGKFTLKQEEI